MEQITATLRNDVPSLMNEVLDASRARQDEEEKLAEIIEGEVAECQAQAAQFKQRQEENCTKVYGLIRELTLKAKKEVEEERAVREQTHDEILSYVEETCNKLGE
jgi:cell division septum initiation protein DivIVA